MAALDERTMAVHLYNRCWELLETDPRTSEDDVELLTSAFASRLHWLGAGGPEQWAISDWMVSRAAGAVGAGELSVWFARRASDAARADGLPDWLVASTAEGMARANFRAGHLREGEEWADSAARLVEAIADEEDRTLIASQLATVRFG